MFSRIWPVINFILVVAAILTFLNVSDLLAKFGIQNPNAILTYILQGILIAAVLMIIISYIKGQKQPVIVVSQECEARYLEADGSKVIINNTQTILPKRPGINAYQTTLNPDPDGGKIPKNEIELKVFRNNGENGGDKILKGSETGGWNCTFHFGSPLEYKWYYDLLPDFLRFDEPVCRTTKALYLDSFTKDDDYFAFFTQKSKYKKVVLKMQFPKSRLPKDDSFQAMRVIDSTIIKEAIQPTKDVGDGYVEYSAIFKNSVNEQLRVSWEFPG